MVDIVKTFNGFNLASSDYQAGVLVANSLPGASLTFIKQLANDPTWSGAFFREARGVPVGIRVKNYANRFALIQALKSAMNPGTTGILVATKDDGIDYQLTATVSSFVQSMDPLAFTAVLQSGPAAWRSVSAETDSWDVTGAGGTNEITVSGKQETRLIASITPTGITTGWAYQNLYQLVAPPVIKYGKRPWCITLDTAALVTAGRMLASGYDCRIVVNDVEVKRWIPNPNNAATKIWFNLDFSPGYSLELLTGVASSGAIGELAFKKTTNNKTALTALPAAGILVHGTEWIKYSAKNVATYKLTVTARGVLGTTLQAHVVGDVFKYIQNVIYVLHGNAAATDPTLTDTNYDVDKPIFDLASSDNTRWVYTATTGFYDVVNPARLGAWKPTLTRIGDQSDTYLFTQRGVSGNLVAGMAEACWTKLGRAQSETAAIAWQMDCPGGIATLASTGSKRATTARWPALVGLQKSSSGTSWSTIWNEAIPVTLSSWTAITHASNTIDANLLRVIISGSMTGLAGAEADLEIATATVAFTSANLPAGALLGQTNQIMLNMILTNQTTGDAISLIFPVLLNRTLLVDGENYVMTLDGMNAHGAMLPDDGGRDVWIRLNPGVNTLAAALTNQGNLTVALSWYPRQL